MPTKKELLDQVKELDKTNLDMAKEIGELKLLREMEGDKGNAFLEAACKGMSEENELLKAAMKDQEIELLQYVSNLKAQVSQLEYENATIKNQWANKTSDDCDKCAENRGRINELIKDKSELKHYCDRMINNAAGKIDKLEKERDSIIAENESLKKRLNMIESPDYYNDLESELADLKETNNNLNEIVAGLERDLENSRNCIKSTDNDYSKAISNYLEEIESLNKSKEHFESVCEQQNKDNVHLQKYKTAFRQMIELLPESRDWLWLEVFTTDIDMNGFSEEEGGHVGQYHVCNLKHAFINVLKGKDSQ